MKYFAGIFGIASETLRESVKSEKLAEFGSQWKKWLVDDEDVFTKREPGLWKLEATGTRMIALSSKLYHMEDERSGKKKMARKVVLNHRLWCIINCVQCPISESYKYKYKKTLIVFPLGYSASI